MLVSPMIGIIVSSGAGVGEEAAYGAVRVRVRVRVGVGVRVRVKAMFERPSGNRTRVDSVCDYEKVPPDQLGPSTKRD